MDIDELLESLSRRHGVPRAFGKKLRPLLVRAEGLEPEARQRVLDLITRSFEEESRRVRAEAEAESRAARLSGNDRKVLRTVAGVLHGWRPPAWLVAWGERRAE